MGTLDHIYCLGRYTTSHAGQAVLLREGRLLPAEGDGVTPRGGRREDLRSVDYFLHAVWVLLGYFWQQSNFHYFSRSWPQEGQFSSGVLLLL